MAAPPPLVPTGQQTFRWIVPQFCQQGRLTTLVTGAEAASWLRDLRMITIEPLERCCCDVNSTEPWIHSMVLSLMARTTLPRLFAASPVPTSPEPWSPLSTLEWCRRSHDRPASIAAPGISQGDDDDTEA